MDIVTMLERAYSQTIEVAAKVVPDDLDRPTPCTEWDVGALVNHFLWASTVLAEATAGKPGPERGSDLVGRDVPASVTSRLEAALGYWHQAGALEATCYLPIGQMPGLFAAHFNLVDLYTHRWDLARALGGDAVMDHELAEAALVFAQGVLTDELRAQVGFAPPVVLGANASPGDQLVAFLGRQP